MTKREQSLAVINIITGLGELSPAVPGLLLLANINKYKQSPSFSQEPTLALDISFFINLLEIIN